jgi:hypothetical protein
VAFPLTVSSSTPALPLVATLLQSCASVLPLPTLHSSSGCPGDFCPDCTVLFCGGSGLLGRRKQGSQHVDPVKVSRTWEELRVRALVQDSQGGPGRQVALAHRAGCLDVSCEEGLA